jgi:hypothetical protein
LSRLPICSWFSSDTDKPPARRPSLSGHDLHNDPKAACTCEYVTCLQTGLGNVREMTTDADPATSVWAAGAGGDISLTVAAIRVRLGDIAAGDRYDAPGPG